MWCCYRLRCVREVDGVELEHTARAFSESIAHACGGRWIFASARPAQGSIDAWYSLPRLPSDPQFGVQWNAQLAAHGLSAARVPNRN